MLEFEISTFEIRHQQPTFGLTKDIFINNWEIVVTSKNHLCKTSSDSQVKTMSNFDPFFRLVSYLPAVFYSLITELIGWIIPREWIAKDVSNEIILITGAGSGLGRNMALEFAKLNASLVLWDINEKGLQETKTMVDGEHKQISRTSNAGKRFCLTYRVDVSNRTQVQEEGKKVFEDINANRPAGEEERYVSVLVNNAGIYHGLYLQDLKDEQIERIFKINILSHFWTVRTFLPNMMKHEKGHIVEIASLAGYAGLLKQTDYCATKFATGKSLLTT